MNHLPLLIKDLGFILVTAAVVTILFKKLKQPVVLGYLIAGLLLGPHFPYFVTVRDQDSVQLWAELGVIFLLFGLGLEFSFKKLSFIGKSAGLTAFIEAPCMMIVGYFLGKTFGWSTNDSLYLGGILSISSTTIIVRAFDELNLKGKKFSNLVLGILIFEDLIAILLLVILTAAASAQGFSGISLLNSILKMIFFMTIWFSIGIYFIPLLLSKIRQYLNQETTVVVALGLCLLMVIIVTQVGFSAPLGAFIMGSIIAETKEGKNIEHVISPIKDLFSAIFFVSVGMLINPKTIIGHYQTIIIITLVLMISKIIFVSIGATIAGQPTKTSVFAGMSMAQVGEFSFIIATLGLTLKVTSDFLYPIAVSVSVLTSFTTPYFIKYSPKLFEKINFLLPKELKNILTNYQTAFNTKSEIGVIGLIWKAYGIRITLNIFIVIAIALFTDKFFIKFVFTQFPKAQLFPGFGAIIALFTSSPFIWGIIHGAPSQSVFKETKEVSQLNSLLVGITTTRLIIGVVIILSLISHFTQVKGSYFISFIVMVFLSFIFRKKIEPFYHSIEKNFLDNLSAKERELIERQKIKPKLTPWDADMMECIVSPNSIINGSTLWESKLKDKFGITVALIERGHTKIIAPQKDCLLMSFDKLFLIGSENSLLTAKRVIEAHEFDYIIPEQDTVGLESFILSEHSPFLNKSIKECGMREAISGLIVGLERDGKRLLNPDPFFVLKKNDLLWVVADINKLNNILKNH
jgi:CPA2 family monovalent cation:H+ antiporter-2